MAEFLTTLWWLQPIIMFVYMVVVWSMRIKDMRRLRVKMPPVAGVSYELPEDFSPLLAATLFGKEEKERALAGLFVSFVERDVLRVVPQVGAKGREVFQATRVEENVHRLQPYEEPYYRVVFGFEGTDSVTVYDRLSGKTVTNMIDVKRRVVRVPVEAGIKDAYEHQLPRLYKEIIDWTMIGFFVVTVLAIFMMWGKFPINMLLIELAGFYLWFFGILALRKTPLFNSRGVAVAEQMGAVKNFMFASEGERGSVMRELHRDEIYKLYRELFPVAIVFGIGDRWAGYVEDAFFKTFPTSSAESLRVSEELQVLLRFARGVGGL